MPSSSLVINDVSSWHVLAPLTCLVHWSLSAFVLHSLSWNLLVSLYKFWILTRMVLHSARVTAFSPNSDKSVLKPASPLPNIRLLPGIFLPNQTASNMQFLKLSVSNITWRSFGLLEDSSFEPSKFLSASTGVSVSTLLKCSCWSTGTCSDRSLTSPLAFDFFGFLSLSMSLTRFKLSWSLRSRMPLVFSLSMSWSSCSSVS